MTSRRRTLALAALGVVFGDIGTSPLYTLKTCFTTANAAPTLENMLGILSLLCWALVLVVCIKYVGVLMRIDHEGEGGILALLALATPKTESRLPVKTGWLTVVVVAGAAMLFGDGIITPAISVISAVEGLGVETTAAQPFIVPISVGILFVLFAIQARGSERLGRLFGPVMLAWFGAIGVSGVVAIVRTPAILAALDPRHGAAFVVHHGAAGFLVFGAVVLAVTGVEALYADMSHFGRAPIAAAWFALVFPCVLANYFGQGANIIADPAAFAAPFYSLTPSSLLLPMVALATIATVIASQALISGAFTLTEQAINLHLWPRMAVRHTSSRQQGQVYVPAVNVVLALGCIALVLVFRSSDRLAAAYGVAVSATMLATTIAAFFVVTRVLHWKRRIALPMFVLFGVVDATFLLAGLPKILEGAWLPLALGLMFVVTSWTWLVGRRSVSRSLNDLQMPLDRYLSESTPMSSAPHGTMVFLTGDPSGIPFISSKHRWIRARAEEERLVVLTLVRASRPYVPEDQRVEIERVSDRLHVVRAHFGYMEAPLIRSVLQACGAAGLQLDTEETSFFYADPKIVAARIDPLPAWQRAFFTFLAKNARPLSDDLEIPAERRVELGVEVAI